MSPRILLIASLAAIAIARSENASPAGGTRIFDHIKELLVRVKAADSLSSPKTSYGTGFVVDASGLLATNYHVISDSVMQPGDQWKIIVELEDNKNIEGQLVDFSVTDDLALVKIDKKFASAVALEPGAPSKGERTFSLGLPHDINMSIIEGTYNGVLEHGPYRIVHVTTPLNAGMSGGPSVNASGKLVGINDARILFANDISFIVPADSLKKLIARVDPKNAKALTKEQAQTKLYSQLEKSQDELVNSLMTAKTQKVDIWKSKSIDVPSYLKCWSEGSDEPQLPYVLKERSCRLDHALFIAQGFDTGTYSLEVKVLEASNINRNSVEKLWGAQGDFLTRIGYRGDAGFFGELDAREVFTPYECKQGFVRMPFWGADKTLRTGFCVRKYKKAKDLYDFAYQWSDYSGPLKVRVSVDHSAVSLKNIKRLMTYWTERFK